MEHEQNKREMELERAIEHKAEEIEELVHELKEERKHEEEEHRKVKVVVHNEDSGRNYELEGHARDTVIFFIELFYAKLGRSRKEDDRLRCETNGSDIFQHAHQNIELYKHEHCHKEMWLFAGGTGGAIAGAR